MRRILSFAFLGLLVSALVITAVWAQGSTAQISGTVKDQTGAVLPGVEITATQTATGIARTVLSDETGFYTVPNLPVGPYRLEASLTGFRTYVRTGIALEVNSNPQINVVMAVGQVTESVEVQANAALVETRSVGVGQVMENERILELPLNGRNVTELITMAGGAVGGNLASGRSFPNQQEIAVAGSISGSVAYALDGAFHNNPYDNLNLPLPFPDALQEFKVETSALSASQGQHAGAQVNAITKSGTNAFHGGLFEFLRNDLFNATSYFAAVDPNTGNKKHSTLKRHQFGGTIGGPVVRNKLFFFAGYQGTRTRQDPIDNEGYVPTPAVLQGDFTTVTSPRCTGRGQINLFTTFDDGTPTGFANNRINPAIFSPAALNLSKRLPAPIDDCGKSVYGQPNEDNDKQLVFRGDWQATASHSILGRGLITTNNRPVPYPLRSDNVLTAAVAGRDIIGQSFAAGDTWLVNPNTVIATRLAANYTDVTRAGAKFFNAADLGVKNVYSYTPKFVQVTVTNGFNVAPATSDDASYRTFSASLNSDAALTRGTHQITIGGNLAHWDSNSNANIFSPGIFTFNGNRTNLGMADFLLGKLTSFRQATPNTDYLRKWYTALYVSDIWRANSRWTLNYGLRWEPDVPETLSQARIQNYSEERRAAGTRSTVFTRAPAGFYYPGDPGHPGKAGRNANWAVFAPRFGFAWDMNGDGKTSVRGSFGVGYDYPNVQMHLWTSVSPPWSLDIVRNNVNFDDPWAGYAGGSPFPAQFSKDAPYILNGGYTVMPYNIDPTQSQNWNLSIQREFLNDWLVSANYIGSHTVHMLMTAPLNPATYFPGNADAGGSCFASGLTFRTTPNAVCSTVQNTDARRRLSLIDFQNTGQFVGPLAEYQSAGNANYNGLLLNVRKRAARGVTLQANYTWSHCISPDQDTLNGSLYSPQDTYVFVNDRDRNHGNCSMDRRHNTNMSAVAEMPRFANNSLRWIASGWRLSTLYRYITGPYLTITAGPGVDAARNGTAVTAQPANQVLPDPYGDRSGRPRTQWFNLAAFQTPTVGTLGSAGKRSVAGPSTWDWDMALSRTFQVREGERIEFRAEIYNIPNSFRPGCSTAALAGITCSTGTFGAVNTPTFVNTFRNNQFFGILQNSRDPRIMQFALKFLF